MQLLFPGDQGKISKKVHATPFVIKSALGSNVTRNAIKKLVDNGG